MSNAVRRWLTRLHRESIVPQTRTEQYCNMDSRFRGNDDCIACCIIDRRFNNEFVTDKFMRLASAIGLLTLLLNPSYASAEIIRFQCSWEDSKPIDITVDTDSMEAKRSDGGRNYKVVKATKWGVWLLVNKPQDKWRAAFQVIQRQDLTKSNNISKAGKWVDVIMSFSGGVTSIEGGICWEQP